MAEQGFTGIFAAPHTPMHLDGSCALDRIPEQVRCLQENGVSGAFLCGTTGEGVALSVPERMAVAERWREAAGDTLQIFIHAGHHSIEESKRLARHAQQEIRADAIAAVAPGYDKPETVRDLVGFCEQVSQDAPDTPFFYYHIPGKTDVPITGSEFLLEAKDRIPMLAGIKYSHSDMLDLGRCLDIAGDTLRVFFGQDENLLAALALGVHGAIGSTYNFATPLYHRLVEAFQAGDLSTARSWQAKARELAMVLHEYRDIVGTKAAMRAIGIDCGPVRLPLRSLTEEEYKAFHVRLTDIGFFDYCCRV